MERAHPKDREEYLTFREVAGILKVSVRTVFAMAAENAIRVTRVRPRSPRISRRDLEAYLAARREG